MRRKKLKSFLQIMPGSWPLHFYRVSGNSMLPTYHPGDTLIGWRWFSPKIGYAIVANHANRLIIKRLIKIEEDCYWLAGDNPAESTDSRHFGPVGRSEIIAKVIMRLG